MKKLISIVIPVLNEEKNIMLCYNRVNEVINQLSSQFNFEIIFTDNHSTDKTFEILQSICNQTSIVKVIRFSRNFGYQKSILTGYLRATGDAVIQLDCDLQDPPELIIEFIRKWEQGYEVVYGIRSTRKEPIYIELSRKFYYRLVNLLSQYPLPVDAGDFRLVDKKVVRILSLIEDANPYLRGAIAEIGFNQVGISYDRVDRKIGKSNFKFIDLILLSLDGILNHSIIPLRIASILGLILSLCTLLLVLGYIFYKHFYGGEWPSGFTTVVVFTLFGISLNALFLGIIGEYLGRIYQQVKKKPLTIIEAEIGFR